MYDGKLLPKWRFCARAAEFGKEEAGRRGVSANRKGQLQIRVATFCCRIWSQIKGSGRAEGVGELDAPLDLHPRRGRGEPVTHGCGQTLSNNSIKNSEDGISLQRRLLLPVLL